MHRNSYLSLYALKKYSSLDTIPLMTSLIQYISNPSLSLTLPTHVPVLKSPLKRRPRLTLSPHFILYVCTHTTPLCRPGTINKIILLLGILVFLCSASSQLREYLNISFPFLCKYPFCKENIQYIKDYSCAMCKQQIAWGLNLDEPSVFDQMLPAMCFLYF